MKKMKSFSFMFMVMILPIFVSCSSDDDNVNENNISYTSEEIVEILTGKWAISGHVSVSGDTNNLVETDYTGTIEFKADQKYSAKSSKISTGGISNISGETYTYDLDISDYLSGTPYNYTILRKDGKYYIAFGSSNNPRSTYQIVSLTKKSFKLVEDEDKAWGSPDDPHYAHYHITIISN